MAVSAGQIVIGVRARLDQFDSAMKNVDRKLARLSRQTEKVATTLQRNVALPIIAVGGVATKSFADFDSAMTKSLAIMGTVSDKMRNEMSSAAKQVAKTTTISASESADAYFFLASAGLNAEQSIAALPQVAAFAQAGMFDMATATDLATDAQSALGLTVKDPIKNLQNLTKVTDVLVRANTLANASVQQFSEALTEQSAGALKGFKKEMEEGVSVLAALADRGIKGSAAGTALTGVLVKLSELATKNAAAFKENNINVFDATGKYRNLADIIKDFENRLEGATDETRAQVFSQLQLNRQVLNTVQTLIGASDKIYEYQDALKNSSNFTRDVAAKQLDSFTSKLKLLKNQLEVVGIEFGGIVAERLTPFLESISENVEKFSQLSKETKALIVDYGIFALKITAIATAAAVAIKLIAAFTATIKLATGALAFLVSPIGLTIAAIAGIGYALNELGFDWSKAAANFKRNIEEIQKQFKRFRDDFVRGLAVITKRLQEFGLLKDVLIITPEMVAENDRNAKRLFQNIAAAAKPHLPKVEKTFTKIKDAIFEVNKKAHDAASVLGKKLRGEVKKLDNDLGGSGGGANEKLKELRNQLKALDREAAETRISENISSAIENLDAGAFRKYAEELYKHTYDATIDGVADGLKGTSEAEEYAAKKAQQAVTETTKSWQAGIDSANQSAVDGWRGLMEDAINGTRFNFVDQMTKAATDIASTLLGALGGGVEKISRNIAGSLGDTLGYELTGAALDVASSAVAAGFSAILNAGANLASGGIRGLTDSSGGNDLSSALNLGSAVAPFLLPTGFIDQFLGTNINGAIADVIGDAFANNGDAQAQARTGLQSLLEEAFGVDVIFGDRGRFEGPWVEAFEAIAGTGVNAFSAVGESIANLAGIAEPIGGQIGFIIAENLNGNLNDAKLLIEQLGLSIPEVGEALLLAGKKGEKSWHEVISSIDELNKLTEKGRVGVGDYIGAFDDLIASGGYGLVAIRNVQNLSIEAAEAGAESLADLRQMLVNSGRYTEEQISQLFQVLEGRGITSLEELENASDLTLGGIVSDLETVGFAWADVSTGIEDAANRITELQAAVRGLEDKTVDVRVRVRYETVNSVPQGLENSDIAPNLPTETDTRGTTSGAKSLGTNINIDARGADAGVEQRLLTAMRSLEDNVVRKAMAASRNEAARYGY